jgi:DNA polymerase III subunit alpha
MLDGAARIPDVIARAVEDGQPAIGITDHGNMYGVLEFAKTARSQGIKPIVGTEAYFVTTSRFDRPKREHHKIFHLTLLAMNTIGYHNLMKAASAAFIDGYFYKPRMDFELLERYGEGLVATTGCLGSSVCQAILAGDNTGARDLAAKFVDVLGRENFFVELQDHGLEEQKVVNRELLKIAKELNIGLLATNDSHYTNREDAEAHDALLCVQTGRTVDDPNRLRFETDEFYLKSASEMRHLFRDHEEACDNTLLIAQRADFEPVFGSPVLPAFPTPPNHDEDSYLRELTMEGAKTRYGENLAPHVIERIEHELTVIKSMGFSAYFLVVWDLVRFARESGIRVGPGRGSAAGSCVAFCLRIVDIDPIRYDLLFERFLNPGRQQMPDIDMDFDSRYRSDVIRYAAERYGSDHVAQIITFSTIKARAAVRDGARVLGYPPMLGDKIAKLMPPHIMGRDTPLSACLELEKGHEDGYKMAIELRQLYESDADARRVVDVARGLEGLRRQDGIHAAAVVITREPLTDYLPIQRKPTAGGDIENAPIVTQYEMHGVEDLGLLKMDFLGLRNLDVMEITLDLIEASTGQRIDIDDVVLDNETTFEMLRRGDTVGVFQLEGGPMRSLLRSLSPTRFEDIAALVALYRPGPMAQNWHNEYADRKNGRKEVSYPHPDLEEILAPTYGLMIYQEQLMRVAQLLAGYSLEEADNLRKATGKKDRKLIAKERSKFVDGCVAQGYERDFGEKIFDTIEPFADYSFNKSHSVGYGFLAYQTAYLKANHPVEFFAALLTSVRSNKDQTAIFLNECRQLGVPVLVPDVNESEQDFVVRIDAEGKSVIRYGMASIRNVGEGVVEHIVVARKSGGPFKDFQDYCERVDPVALNKRTVKSLAQSGAFDSLGHPRKGLVEVHEAISDSIMERRRRLDQGTLSFFDLESGGLSASDDASTEIPEVEYDKSERLTIEKEMLGLYVSDHPLLGVEHGLARLTDGTISELRERGDGVVCTFGGVVTGLTRRHTRKGDLMASFFLEDLAAVIEVMVFPKVMQSVGDLLEDDVVVCVRGRIDQRDEAVKLTALEVKRPVLTTEDAPIRVRVPLTTLSDDRVAILRSLLSRHPGNSPVYVHLEAREKTTVIKVGDAFRVAPTNGLFGELRELLGEHCLL